MRWIGSMILGIVLWYVLTHILGFVMGIEGLDHAIVENRNSATGI